jgi:hypothetical protein
MSSSCSAAFSDTRPGLAVPARSAALSASHAWRAVCAVTRRASISFAAVRDLEVHWRLPALQWHPPSAHGVTSRAYLEPLPSRCLPHSDFWEPLDNGVQIE